MPADCSLICIPRIGLETDLKTQKYSPVQGASNTEMVLWIKAYILYHQPRLQKLILENLVNYLKLKNFTWRRMKSEALRKKVGNIIKRMCVDTVLDVKVMSIFDLRVVTPRLIDYLDSHWSSQPLLNDLRLNKTEGRILDDPTSDAEVSSLSLSSSSVHSEPLSLNTPYNPEDNSDPDDQPYSPKYIPQSPNYVPQSTNAPLSSPEYSPQILDSPSSPSSSYYSPSSSYYSPSSSLPSLVYSSQSPEYSPQTLNSPPSPSSSQNYSPYSPSCLLQSPNYKPQALNSPLLSPEYSPHSPEYSPPSPDSPSNPIYVPQSPSSMIYVPHLPSSPIYVPHSSPSPIYVPHSPQSPSYLPLNPDSPKSPDYSPPSPEFLPASPDHSPKSPEYLPASPKYSPQYKYMHSLAPDYLPQCGTHSHFSQLSGSDERKVSLHGTVSNEKQTQGEKSTKLEIWSPGNTHFTGVTFSHLQVSEAGCFYGKPRKRSLSGGNCEDVTHQASLKKEHLASYQVKKFRRETQPNAADCITIEISDDETLPEPNSSV